MFCRRERRPPLKPRVDQLERQVRELRTARGVAYQDELVRAGVIQRLEQRSARRRQRVRDAAALAGGCGGIGALIDLIGKAL
jgi:hypothetical protein